MAKKAKAACEDGQDREKVSGGCHWGSRGGTRAWKSRREGLEWLDLAKGPRLPLRGELTRPGVGHEPVEQVGRENFSLGGQEQFLHVFLANAKAAAGDDGYDLESGFAARRLFGTNSARCWMRVTLSLAVPSSWGILAAVTLTGVRCPGHSRPCVNTAFDFPQRQGTIGPCALKGKLP